MVAPEPCLKGRCYSPTACNGWGYCRERNMRSIKEFIYITAEQMQRWRDEAAGRRALDHKDEG